MLNGIPYLSLSAFKYRMSAAKTIVEQQLSVMTMQLANVMMENESLKASRGGAQSSERSDEQDDDVAVGQGRATKNPSGSTSLKFSEKKSDHSAGKNSAGGANGSTKSDVCVIS